MPRPWRKHFLRKTHGSVLLETALMLTVLLMLAFGIVDLGRVMYLLNSLTQAAREGARTGAVTQSLTQANVQDTVRQRFNSPNGYTFGGPALTNSNITVTILSGGSVKVAIAYPLQWLTPIPRLLRWTVNPTFTDTLHAKAEYKYEF